MGGLTLIWPDSMIVYKSVVRLVMSMISQELLATRTLDTIHCGRLVYLCIAERSFGNYAVPAYANRQIASVLKLGSSATQS